MRLNRKDLTIEHKDEVHKLAARISLLRFTKYTKPDYVADKFHEILCSALDRFLRNVIAKKSPRMMIMAPPRSGKSELVSRRFPALALGKYPDLKILATSHGGELASAMNRDVQRIIDDTSYVKLFPRTRLSGAGVRYDRSGTYLRNSDVFEIVNHSGMYRSTGVGGALLGFGGNILIIDDPIKNSEEAHSQTVRDSIWAWYQSAFYTRCEPGAGILIMHQRWHEDDLAGRLLINMKKGGEQWEVLSFPAIAEQDESFRKVGEALCPSRFPLERLEYIRIGTEDEIGVGSRAWDALYQQRPSSKSGEYFKRENWQYIKLDPEFFMWDAKAKRKYMTQILGVNKLIQAWDTAIGAKKVNDFAACTTLGVTKNRYIAFEVWRDRVKYPEMRREVQTRSDAWCPDVIVIEGGGAAAGKAVIQDLRPETRLPLKEVPTDKDKELRADMLSPIHEAGRCALPEGASWVSSFVDVASQFPSVKNDDDLDSWMLAMEEAKTGPKPLVISDELLAWSAQPGRR
jgi:predicted phage terminase large subunit-like protein